MNIVWLSWKDKKHPAAGGAETVSAELAKRLARDGHRVVFLTAGFPGVAERETFEGFEIVRLGRKLSVYWQAWRYYRKNLKDWADLVIDEVNTMPFFAKFYAGKKSFLFVHQLCREIWFYQLSFPWNILGYLLEPVYLRLLADRQVITVSESTKQDLIRHGFREENIRIISEGIEIEPKEFLDKSARPEKPFVLALGAIRPMKRTHHVIRAFEAARAKMENLELTIAGAGGGAYGRKIMSLIKNSPFRDSIKYLGRVAEEEKMKLMGQAQLLCAASVKEGWGLTVTEANSQGTPAVVYDVDGLRDSVRHGETGIVCQINTPEEMGGQIAQILEDRERYEQLRQNAWQWSREINFEKSYRDFLSVIG